MKIKIDSELKAFIPRPTAGLAELREAIIRDKRIIDPIIVWKEKGIILDGHRRYDVHRETGLPYTVEYVSLPNRDAAKAWMFAHQVTRRNWSRDQIVAFALLNDFDVPATATTYTAKKSEAMCADDEGRRLLRSVLDGRYRTLTAAYNEWLRGQGRAIVRSRGTPLDHAKQQVQILSSNDLERFSMWFRETYRGLLA